MFNDARLREIGRELVVKKMERKNRDELLKRIGKIRNKPGTLKFRNLEYIRIQAKDLNI